MTLSIRSIIFCVVFLFTLKFELLNNLILLGFIFFYINEIKIKVRSIKPLLLPFIILIFFFVIFTNINYLKYCIYVLRFLFLLFFAEKILVSKELNLREILEKIFYIHTITIILCYFFPTINNFFTSIFSYSSDSEYFIASTTLDVYNLRVTGFIQGYDFVPFLIVTYLSYEYLILKKKLSKKFIIKLLIGTLASLFSGRFSFVPLFILFIFIFFNRKHLFLKTSIIGVSFVILIKFFDKIIFNIYNTLKIVYDLILLGSGTDLSMYSRFSEDGINVAGQYNLSPLTLLNEFLIPFLDWKNYILPSSLENIDSGPSFMVLNLGFILSGFLYIYFFKTIKAFTKHSMPLIVVLIFLSIDFKFRSIYVLFPTVWLVVNHVNYVKFFKK
jgi:hypothetical protein